MTSLFLQRLCTLIADTEPLGPERLPHVRPAFEDTLAVAYSGWAEPVTRKVAANYRGGEAATPENMAGVEPEAAATILGTAVHAMDFDDVHQVSYTHPSVPIVAGLTVAVQEEPALAHRATTAFAIGLACNVEIGRVLGFSHYEKGWHATSTIGPVAAAAALSYFYGLDGEAAAHALALGAAHSAGLQRNFGSMTKPLQAGLAGAAGLRAARLARAGFTGDGDVFAEKGFFDLFQGAQLEADPDRAEFDLFSGGIAVKLYPCCYLNHRNIALAFEAREALQAKGLTVEDVGKVEVEGPYGAFVALRVHDAPKVGSEGKFCGPYVAACALIDGEVGLRHFEDDQVSRADLRALQERVTLRERPETGGQQDGFHGVVRMIVFDRDGQLVASAERTASPGAPDDAATKEQIEAKVRDCLAYYSAHGGQAMDYDRFQAFLDGLFAVAAPGAEQPARAALGDG